jgi:hypothetical protein
MEGENMGVEGKPSIKSATSDITAIYDGWNHVPGLKGESKT